MAEEQKKQNSEENDPDVSTEGDYDGLEYDNSSNFHPKQERTDYTICQNPYYEGIIDTNTSVDIVQDLTGNIKEIENVKTTQNPYYE